MQTVKLQAQTRDQSGKGSARQLRRDGQIPGVFYGKGVPTRSLTLSPKELVEAVSGEMGLNVLIDLELDGQSYRSLVADYQYHPVTRQLLHADFRAINEQTPVNVEVPLELVGRAKGIVAGGKLQVVFRKVPIRCLPQQIPAKIVHDISELDIEQTFTVADLKLPEGVQVRYPAAQTLGGVYGSRKRAAAGEEESGESK